MQRNFLLCAIIFTCVTITVSAQTSFNWGPELGFSTSGLNKTSVETSPFDVTTSSTIPEKSMLFGINSQLDIKKHFNVNAGIRFQTIGETHESIREGQMYITDYVKADYISIYNTKHLYHKLSLPLSVGFQFNIGKINTNFYTGYIQNYILDGSYIETNSIDCEDDSRDYFTTKFENPLTAAIPVNRFTGQLNTGMSFTYKNSIVLKAEANFGGYLSFAVPSPYSFCVLYGGGMRNNDYTVSVSYLF